MSGAEPKASRGFSLLVGFGFGALLLGVTVVFFPVEWKEAKTRFRFWQAKARPVLWEKHRGFTQDRCRGESPERCPCLWLIHGLGDSLATWKNVFLNSESFRGEPVRLYAIDLPGHGGSLKRRDPAEYRVSNIAHELDTEIAKTSLCTNNTLIGNSFGGWIAARMAIASPTRYLNLVLIGPAGLEASQENFNDLREFQKRAYFKPRELSEKEWAFAAKRIQESEVASVRQAQVPEDRLDGDLRKIRARTLIISGDADRIIPRSAIEKFAREIPRAERVTLSECGHLPQKECPEKFFNALGVLRER